MHISTCAHRSAISHGPSSSSSSLLSLQVLEGPWALSWVIQESMSLKYEPVSVEIESQGPRQDVYHFYLTKVLIDKF